MLEALPVHELAHDVRLLTRCRRLDGVRWARAMFCFWCGADLVRIDGELRCVKTGMALSRALEDELKRLYEPNTPDPVEGRAALASSRWHCPGCGERIDRTCNRCRVTLDDRLVFLFVELHPHPGA